MSKGNEKGWKSVCPACEAWVIFKKQPHVGQLVTCESCESELKVVIESPIRLDWAFEPEEDSYEIEDFRDRYLDSYDYNAGNEDVWG